MFLVGVWNLIWSRASECILSMHRVTQFRWFITTCLLAYHKFGHWWVPLNPFCSLFELACTCPGLVPIELCQFVSLHDTHFSLKPLPKRNTSRQLVRVLVPLMNRARLTNCIPIEENPQHMPPLLRRPEIPLCVIPYLQLYIIDHGFRFALIIGIDEYANGSKLGGAVADAKAMKQFLEKHFRIPEANIVSLFNEKASRLAIIDAFRKLRDNELIEKGDPIVIYFSGHGCERPAPDAWGPGSRTQCLLPQDYKAVGTEPILDQAPIPDRAIGALLEDIAKEKGDNIVNAIPCFVPLFSDHDV